MLSTPGEPILSGLISTLVQEGCGKTTVMPVLMVEEEAAPFPGLVVVCCIRQSTEVK